MTTHPPALVRAVADAITTVAKRHPVPSDLVTRTGWPPGSRHYLGASTEQLAKAALDAVDAHRRARVVQAHPDAVRLVEDILDAHLIDVGEGRELDAETGTAIVDALIGTPLAHHHVDEHGHPITILDWPSDEHQAALIARELLDELVADLNATRCVLAERDRDIEALNALVALHVGAPSADMPDPATPGPAQS